MKKKTILARWLPALAMAGLSYFVFLALAGRPASDLSIHATWAAEGSFRDLTTFVHHSAHPLWHALVALVLRTGLPLAPSAALVTAIFKGAEVWLLTLLAEQALGDRGWLAAACGLIAATVSGLWVPFVNPTVYLGVGSPNPWHSPTQLAAVAFMLVCVPMTAACVETFQRRLPELGVRATVPWRDASLLSGLLLLSLVAKPTFMQAFFPAACLYFLMMWLRRPHNGAFFWRMMAVAAPSALFMAAQYLYYFGIIVPSQGSMIIAVTWSKAGEVALSVLLTRAFPLFVLATYADREIWRKPLYQLTLVMDAVSILEMLFLSENGRRAADGNFGWAMMGSALMLWAVTLPLFARRARAWITRRKAAAEGQPYLEDRPRAEAVRYGVGSALLLWHLASGLYYAVYLLTTGNAL